MDPLKSVAAIAASGMTAQAERLRVVSENMANANSTGTTPGADPYRRKTISFGEMMGGEGDVSMVEVTRIGRDMSDFTLVHDPAHPAADADGFVKRPNVNSIMELSNMREASRSYEANMNMFEAGRRMRSQMIDLLK